MQLEGLILAGGRGSRMGGVDKGWVTCGEYPMVQLVARTLRPLVSRVLISCNRNLERYCQLADQVVSDLVPDFPGPLAGVQSALAVTSATHLLILPCDTPWVGRDLLKRMIDAACSNPQHVVVVVREGEVQPLHAVLPVACRPALARYLADGRRSVQGFYAQLPVVTVSAESGWQLDNLNSEQELRASWLNHMQRALVDKPGAQR
jgi:molybdopterin-guanine dinucleotide biosynthesis protein A